MSSILKIDGNNPKFIGTDNHVSEEKKVEYNGIIYRCFTNSRDIINPLVYAYSAKYELAKDTSLLGNNFWKDKALDGKIRAFCFDRPGGMHPAYCFPVEEINRILSIIKKENIFHLQHFRLRYFPDVSWKEDPQPIVEKLKSQEESILDIYKSLNEIMSEELHEVSELIDVIYDRLSAIKIKLESRVKNDN